MKVILTVKTGKGKKSTKKEIDKTVDVLMKLEDHISKSFKWKEATGKCFCDGTSMTFEK